MSLLPALLVPPAIIAFLLLLARFETALLGAAHDEDHELDQELDREPDGDRTVSDLRGRPAATPEPAAASDQRHRRAA
jgi:hypothetical protein